VRLRACLTCGRTIPATETRCERCLPAWRAHVNACHARAKARRQLLGRDLPEVRRAMADAVALAGRCRKCGVREGLTAHLPGGGVHPPLPGAYVVLCRPCHQRLEATVRARER
jgi:hypothetical protein